MNKPFDSAIEPGKGAEGDQLRDGGFHRVANAISLPDIAPWIGFKLFESKRYLFVVRIDTENLNLDFVTFLKHLGGMVDLFCPRHIRDMEKTVNTFLNLNKCAVIGQIANQSIND